jgi:uncharacterized membrane protein YecN with MAPEG domain
MKGKQESSFQFPPLSLVLFTFPLGAAIAYFLINTAWTATGVIPAAYLTATPLMTAFRCIALCAAIQIPTIFLISMCRAMTRAKDTLLYAESDFMKVNINTANNNGESILIFSCSLLAHAALCDPTSERVILLTTVFLISRMIFWFGYNLSLIAGGINFRGLGFFTTAFLNVLLGVTNTMALCKALN